MNEKINKFKNILERELDKELDKIIAAGAMNPNDTEVITKAICLMLKVNEYEEWEAQNGEYSYEYGDYSNRRGRSMTTGRYASRDYGPVEPYQNDPRMRSYERGYSGHSIKDRAVSKLEMMYDDAKTDHERQMLTEYINMIESSH